jgi:hypothetical protein
MALHRNIGYISPYEDAQAIDQQFYTNGGGGGGGDIPRDETIVIEEYYPKDPVYYPIDPLPIEPLPADDVQPINQEIATTVAETEITSTTSYARGIVYADADKRPIKSQVQLIDIATGTPVSQPEAIEAGHQFLIWTNNPGFRAIKITAEGFKAIAIPFEQVASSYPGALEIYLNKSGNNAMLFAGLGLAFIIATRKKKKKVGRTVDDVYKFYEGLPPIAKGILTVGGGWIIYRVLDKIFQKKPDDLAEPQAAQSELTRLAQMGIYPTHSNAEFESYSNAIVQAVWDCGTDEDAIINVMEQMNNEADIYALIAVYGVRAYKGCFENFFSLVERSLTGTLSSELDAGEKSDVNDILAQKGISFRFT